MPRATHTTAERVRTASELAYSQRGVQRAGQAIQDAEQRPAVERDRHRMQRQAMATLREDADLLASQGFSRRAWDAVIASPCTVHHARAGVPCWTIASDRPHRAICGQRVRLVFAEVSR